MTKLKRSTKSVQHTHEKISPAKMRSFIAILTLVFFLITVFLFRWQVLDYDKYIKLAGARQLQIETPALRGDILARDGSVLSYSEPRFDIYVYKNEKQGLIAAENNKRQTREEFLTGVGTILQLSKDDVAKKLEPNSQWLKLAEKVSKEQRDRILAIPTQKDPKIFLDGLVAIPTSVRLYPERNLAAQVIGFLGDDEFGKKVGRGGLEQYYNETLNPITGISTIETDSNQNIIAISDNKLREAQRGMTVKTTIDKNIQAKAQYHLKAAVERYRAKSGSVIIADPRTGEIIAMASYPDYNPAEYNKVTDIKVLGNTAVTTPYEIGSVGKIYTMSAAVDQGKVGPNTVVINGHEGCQRIVDNRKICTYSSDPRGPLTATQAMIESDNLALFSTANLIGGDTLAKYLDKFGMGKRTNIQLPGEDSGVIKPSSQWTEADLATYSFGHSYTQTLQQAVMAVSALANHGRIMEPMVVSELINEDGKVRKYTPRVVSEVLSEKGVQTMAQILHEVYLSNIYTYKNREFQGLDKYNIGMKSGTALIPFVSLANPVNKAGYSDEVNSTYVGYDASEKNTFIMLVNLSEPQSLPKLSYNNARLLWFNLFNDIKDDLGVPVKK